MKRIIMVLCAAATLAPLPAFAFGALAVGVPADVSKDGFAYAMQVNAPSEQQASDSALNTCRGTSTDPNVVVHSQSSAPARAVCAIVQTFSHQCAVVAEDPAAGTPGVGWGIAPTLDVATQQAMANCRATAGASRQQFCAVDSQSCDGQ